MHIVIETQYVDPSNYDETEIGFSSFTNRGNTTPTEIWAILEKLTFGNAVVPSLYYLENLGNNPNIFTPPDGRGYFVEITEISLCYMLPPDCHETGLDISDFLSVVVNGVQDPTVINDLINKAFVEIDHRLDWIKTVPDKPQFKIAEELIRMIKARITK